MYKESFMAQTVRQKIRQTTMLVMAATAVYVLGVFPTTVLAQTNSQQAIKQKWFEDIAQEFSVPKEVLLATSYYQTRWENHDGEMSIDGGFGLFNLRTNVTLKDSRGDDRRPLENNAKTIPEEERTLDRAAQLLKIPANNFKTDDYLNIRGGAAVLVEDAKKLNSGKLPSDLGEWITAAGSFVSNGNPQTVQLAAQDIQNLVQKGASATTSDGQVLSIPSVPNVPEVNPNIVHTLGLGKGAKAELASTNRAECPKTLTCRYVPALYAPFSSDPADYGNYDHSNRPKDMKVKYIVIHDTEGSYSSAISWFQTPGSYVSGHYVIRSSDGEVTQMVDTQDTAWHAGDWYVNMHSIGVEHEGFAAAGATWYSEAMYRSSATLVRYLANKYNIPLDREHIIGHDNVPGLTDKKAAAMHHDPGPFWNWDYYMSLIRGEDRAPKNIKPHKATSVTIKPDFARNIQTQRDCDSNGNCRDVSGPSNFVYLRTSPDANAPLISDTLLHPDGSPGTNRINDWTAKATDGQQYALAGRQGDWAAIWFGGRKAWFYNPASQRTATFGKGKTITLKPGLSQANVYGGAFPEAGVYPPEVAPVPQPKLSYTIASGQKYVVEGVVPTDYFYDATINHSKPYDHEVFRGKDKFYQIWYNQRLMYVRATDVVIE